jgi:hypothetical protein
MLLAYLRWPTLLMLLPMLLLTEAMLWGYALLRGRSFLSAKARSYLWLWRTRHARSARRRHVQSLRTRGDAEVLRAMHWRYAWRQFGALARERGVPRRRLDERASGDRGAVR